MRTEADDPLTLHRDALRRIVYGTPDPSAAVIAELVAVEAELVAREAVVDGDRPVSESKEPPRARDPQPGFRSDPVRIGAFGRSRLPRWVLVGSLAVALTAAVLVLSPVRDALSPPRGLEVFERPQTAEEQGFADQVVERARLQPASPTALRSLGRVFGYEFWVHREEDRVCLLSRREFWFEWVDECVTLEEFGATGLARVIPAGELPDRARSSADIAPDDAVVVSWGADSLEIEWSIVPARIPVRRGDRDPALGLPFGVGDAPMTYEEWSSSRIAEQPRGS